MKKIICSMLFGMLFFINIYFTAYAFGAEITSADPIHKIEFSFNKETLTYSDGSNSVFDRSYKALIINGTLIKADVKTVNDRTLVPIRALVEALNGSIDWNPDLKKVTVNKDDIIIEMIIADPNVYVNGISQTIDVPPNIYNDFTYLPIRFVSETIGAKVSYTTGVYDAASKKFNDFMIVQGIQGNVIVDQFDPLLIEITSEQSVNSIRTILDENFTILKQNLQSQGNNPANIDRDTFLIKESIDSTNIITTVSRYYVIESLGLFLFDKYTGDIFELGSDMTSNWVNRFNPQDTESIQNLLKKYLF